MLFKLLWLICSSADKSFEQTTRESDFLYVLLFFLTFSLCVFHSRSRSFFSFFLCFFSLLSFRLLLLLAFSLNGTSFCFLKFWCLSLWKRLNMKATKTDFSSCCWWLYFFLFVSQTRALHSFGVLVSYNYDYQDLRLFSIIAVVPHFFIIINVLFSSPCSSYSFENEKVWNECRKKYAEWLLLVINTDFQAKPECSSHSDNGH